MNNNAKFKFIFMSLLGVIFFIVPLGDGKIFMSHFVNFVTNNFLELFLLLTQVFAIITIVGTLLSFFIKNQYIEKYFKTTIISAILRILGSLLYLAVLQGLFTEVPIVKLFVHEYTGGVLAGPGGLLTTLYLTFFIGLLALPLLTHFGSVEFLGTLCSPFMKKVFKVPGFSAVDAIASFVGDGTIGIVVTDNQYQRGYYTKKEAFIIATNFSIVGIAFAAAVAAELQFDHIFPIFYASIAIVTVIIAIISARIPWAGYKDEYFEGVTPVKHEISEDETVYSQAIKTAVEQAEKANFLDITKESLNNIAGIYIGFLPIIMIVGTFSLVVAENTDIFNYLGFAFVPVFQLFGFTKEIALELAPASIVGITDMYLPALFVTELESEAARFFIGVLSFTQLVYFSETGIILMKSKLNINIFKVIGLFLYRTILSLPLVMIITKALILMNIISM